MAILITAAANSAAYRFERILASAGDVFFADTTDLPPIPSRKFLRVPVTSSITYTHEILTLCLDHGIDHVYPLHRDEVTELSKASQLFDEYGISLIIPSERWLIINALNVFQFRSSNVLVLENGMIKAGELPEDQLPDNEMNGIFSWILKEDSIVYSLFVFENAEL